MHFDPNIRLGDIVSAGMACLAIITLYVRTERVLAALLEWKRSTDTRLLTIEGELRDNSDHVSEIRGALRLAGRAAKE